MFSLYLKFYGIFGVYIAEICKYVFFFQDYEEEGFLAMQRAIDKAIIQVLNTSSFLPLRDIEVYLQRYPYPPYVEDFFILVSQYQLPFIIFLSFLVVAPNLAKDVVLEKERMIR